MRDTPESMGIFTGPDSTDRTAAYRLAQLRERMAATAHRALAEAMAQPAAIAPVCIVNGRPVQQECGRKDDGSLERIVAFDARLICREGLARAIDAVEGA